MIKKRNRPPLRVSTDGGAGPFIMLPVDQLEAVKAKLDDAKVDYWVDDEAISSDGDPEVTFINLAEETDPKSVQKLLDSVR